MAERSSQQEVTRAEDSSSESDIIDSTRELHEISNAENSPFVSSRTNSIYASTKFYRDRMTESESTGFCKALLNCIQGRKVERTDERHVMIAGLSRSGKSTALNNIFDLNLEANPSAGLVTKRVSISTITKEFSTSESPINFYVADTPGMKDATIDEMDVLNQMKEFGIKKDFVLLLTLPVSPTSTMTSDYSNIIGNLTILFDNRIWNQCIFLLTCSDSVCQSDIRSDSEQDDDYRSYLVGHCQELQKELAKYGVHRKVKLFFEYSSEEMLKNIILDGIVAMPVGRSSNVPTIKLLPYQPWTHKHDWTDLLFTEIAKLDPQGYSYRKVSIHRNYCNLVTIKALKKLERLAEGGIEGAAAGVVIGGTVGGGIGAVIVGVAGGGIGAVIGGVVGGASGAVIGGVAGAVIGGMAGGAIGLKFGVIAGAALGMIGGALAGGNKEHFKQTALEHILNKLLKRPN